MQIFLYKYRTKVRNTRRIRIIEIIILSRFETRIVVEFRVGVKVMV